MTVSADAPRPAVRLYSAGDLAKLFGSSIRHIYRLRDAGKLPQPLRLGALVRWDARSIDDWLAAGCPSCRHGAARGGVR